MKIRLLLLMVLITFLFSCKKDNSDLSFTNKWWKSADIENAYIRFESDGTFSKEIVMNTLVPTINTYNLQKVIINGKWHIEGDKITLETSELKEGLKLNNIDTANTIGYYYGYITYDSIRSNGDFINPRWIGISNDSVDIDYSIRAYNYMTYSTSPTIWVLLDVQEDYMNIIINSRSAKFIYDRDKE
jgi:hypothetical protein